MKKLSTFLILVLCVALILCSAGCGAEPAGDSSPAPSEPDVTASEPATATPEAPDTSDDDSPASVDLEALASDILAALPEAYQGSDLLNVSCEDEEGSVYVIMQIDQGSDDADAALALAAECYTIAKDTVEGKGAELDSIGVTVLDAGIYATSDGKNFTVVANGKRTEVSLP